MCLAVPAKIIGINSEDFSAEVDIMGNKKNISVILTPQARVGDWVLIHAGEAISIMTDEEARASLEIWEQLLSQDG